MSHPRGGGDETGGSGTAMATSTAITTGDRDWRSLLLAFYGVYNRERMGDVDEILGRYKGQVGRGARCSAHLTPAHAPPFRVDTFCACPC